MQAVKRSSLMRGQRVVLDAGSRQAAVEPDDGRIELVPKDLVVPAESAESVEKRQRGA
jgi:hypothetical protein